MKLSARIFAISAAAMLTVGAIAFGSFARQPAAVPEGMCGRFDVERSSAFNSEATPIAFPWRRDLPATADPAATHAWDSIRPQDDWQGYMAAFLSEVKASGLTLGGGKGAMKTDAEWWVTPWMDYGDNGREKLMGLTKERNPGQGDLAPNSGTGRQVWAVGFYNRDGAQALGQVYADPCNPQVPVAGFTLPEGSASFKLLFTTATGADAAYLEGSPEVKAFVTSTGGRSEQVVRLLQMDIAVRDSRSPTGWVMGTYIWQGPKKGDGLFDNLVPVGLMWGNDGASAASPRDAFAHLAETRLNPDLAGVVWRGPGQSWDARPWPGFQGRLNGPADNMMSTCLSCHALAQWPRSKRLSILPVGPTYTMSTLNDEAVRATLARDYLKNVKGGTLTDPSEAVATADRDGARPLDYSLQLEASFTRMCAACKDGAMTGQTPAMCRIRGATNYVDTPTCKGGNLARTLIERFTTDKPARQ